MRYLIATSLVMAASTTWAQTVAVPPDRQALERLQLITDWSAMIPVENRIDGISHVQIVDQSQIFVQTRAGMLVALDANTGRTLWQYKYPAGHTSGFPVGVNNHYVFAINISKIICLDRFRGSLEFEYDFFGSPIAGPVADQERIYMCQSGSVVMALQIPVELRNRYAKISETRPGALAGVAGAGQDKSVNIADSVADRFAGRLYPANPKTEVDRFQVPQSYRDRTGGESRSQRTPSLAMLQSVVPPYSAGNLNSTPSLSALPSVRLPYTLYPEHSKYNQQTPSIQMMNSVARYSEMSSLRPRPIEPSLAWKFGTVGRPYREPVLAHGLGGENEGLVWLIQDGANFAAVSVLGQARKSSRLDSPTVSPLSGPYNFGPSLLGFIAFDDGRVAAVDMLNFSDDSPRYEWIARVGGNLGHKPLADKDSVYVSGSRSGISRVNVKTGELDWRTEDTIDQILAINEDYVYARDRQDQMHILPKNKLYDSTRKLAKSLATLSIPGFNVVVNNDLTDRVILVAETGLIVVLRQNATKYNRPVRVPPPSELPPPPKVPMMKDPNAPMTGNN